MEQLDLFGPDINQLQKEIDSLKKDLDTLRRGAFYQITNVRKEMEQLAAHCEVMSDQLFEKEKVS